MAIIVSYGGGVNSTAMLIGMVKHNIKPTDILFADTGAEQEETYAYVKHFSEWLTMRGFPEIKTVKYKTKHGEELTIVQDIKNNKTIPSIAFGWKTCSQKFKIQPQAKYIDMVYGNDIHIWHYIGFDAGESERQLENPIKHHSNTYPLIIWGWDRAKCKEIIIEAGLCVPPKSSCFCCPNMKKHEILALPDNLKEEVKAIEANATKLSELKGLGRTYSWTDLINADESQHKLFDDLEMFRMPCKCID